MRAYVLTFDHSALQRQVVLNYLDTQPAIRNWRAVVGAVLIATDLEINALSDMIRAAFPGHQFLVVESQPFAVQGWADQATWDFFNSPQPWPGR